MGGGVVEKKGILEVGRKGEKGVRGAGAKKLAEGGQRHVGSL